MYNKKNTLVIGKWVLVSYFSAWLFKEHPRGWRAFLFINERSHLAQVLNSGCPLCLDNNNYSNHNNILIAIYMEWVNGEWGSIFRVYPFFLDFIHFIFVYIFFVFRSMCESLTQTCFLPIFTKGEKKILSTWTFIQSRSDLSGPYYLYFYCFAK